MPKNLLPTELESFLSATYSSSVKYHDGVRERRKENIDSFLEINRKELKYNTFEHQILLYSTLWGEKIYIQYPGKESDESRKNPMPKDFRPKLEYADGTIMPDATFAHIWDILEKISKDYNGYLYLVAVMIFRMGYMYDYSKTNNLYERVALNMNNGKLVDSLLCDSINFNWHHLNISDDIWYTLNFLIRNIMAPNEQMISFEAFIKYIDLLLQNEDCKYFYIKTTDKKRKKPYNLENGRIQSCNSILLVLDYLRKNKSISELLGGFRRGVASFKVSEYSKVTNGIVKKI